MQGTQNFLLWLLGPTASGKTTLGHEVKKRLDGEGLPVLHYDGDEVRDFFGELLGFEEKDRFRVVRTIVHLARKANESGINVVVSALTAHAEARAYIQRECSNIIVGYLRCGIDTCVRRDPKGIYKLARDGEIDTLIGYNTAYEEPAAFDFDVDTEQFSIGESVDRIIRYLRSRKYI